MVHAGSIILEYKCVIVDAVSGETLEVEMNELSQGLRVRN